jgi:hypothetical protein
MSQLQKAITRTQRREVSGGLGFGQARKEQPKAMLAGVAASDEAAARAMLAAGADLVLIRAKDAAGALKALKSVAMDKSCVGVQVSALDAAGAEALHKAHCDFVISPLESTAAAALDPEMMGHVLVGSATLEDTTLRALGPLGLDALYVDLDAGAMTLASQLALVRLSSFSSTALLVAVNADTPVGELRVLRDSGVVAVIAPEGTTVNQLEALISNLKAVPAPKKNKREGNEMAIVPSMASKASDDEEDDDDGEDE